MTRRIVAIEAMDSQEPATLSFNGTLALRDLIRQKLLAEALEAEWVWECYYWSVAILDWDDFYTLVLCSAEQLSLEPNMRLIE